MKAWAKAAVEATTATRSRHIGLQRRIQLSQSAQQPGHGAINACTVQARGLHGSTNIGQQVETFGSVRKDWRPMLAKLQDYPSLQKWALGTAAFFSSPSDVEFYLPRTFASKYTLAELLGEGAFGRVHRVVPVGPRSDNLDLAVKIIPKERVVNARDYTALQQEGKMMMLLGGTLNVVHFFGAYEDDENVYLVMEHCVGGDVAERLQRDLHPRKESLVAMYMIDILHVVWQCHLLGILHGDLKLENFLFADSRDESPLKLTDFGGASFLRDHEWLHDVRGTPLYTAPEVLQNKYSVPSDMWSCGVILFRLLSGRFPFESGALLDERIQYEQIDWDAAPWPEISDQAKSLVQQLLERDPTKRLTARQSLRHPWLASAQIETTSEGSPKPVRTEPPPLYGTMMQRLQLHRTFNSFQQTVFFELAKILPAEATEHLVVLFTELSHGDTLQVGINELTSYLDASGYRVSRGEVKSFLNGLDMDGDGFLTLHEFCAALVDWASLQSEFLEQWEELVGQVFRDVFDLDGDGFVSEDDLERLVPSRRQSRSHSFLNDIKRSFRAVDTRGQGRIGLAEFQSMLRLDVPAYKYYARRLTSYNAPIRKPKASS